MSSKFALPLAMGGFDEVAHSDMHGTACLDPSLTRQSETEDADINVIVRRFGLLGGMPKDARPLMYGDFSDVGDFQSAFAAVADANALFMSMPAEVRARFGNDPQQFLEFCENGQNREEAKKLGLLFPEEPEAKPMEVIVKNAELSVEPAKPAKVSVKAE